jgi:hypothetical protein
MAAPRRTRPSAAAAVLAAAALLAGTPLASAQQNPELERKRLELDVERLEREAGPAAQVQRWLPALSLIVAAVAAGYGVWRYFDERRRAEEGRIEDSITHNLERFTDRPSDANLSARAITALRALDALTPVTGGGKAAKRRSDVTQAVTAILRDDIMTFETRHDARLPVICLDHWPDFQGVAADDRQLCREVLGRYVEALEAMTVRAPVFVPRVKRQNDGYTAAGPLSPLDALLFPVLVTGFERYLELVPVAEDREEAVERFTNSAEALGRQLFVAGP